MFLKKPTAALCSTAMAMCSLLTSAPIPSDAAVSSEMRNISTQQVIDEMGLGINLGNTYESCGDWIAQWGDGTVKSYVTAWGSPVITRNMIQGYADAGFGVLRIPVAWSNMMGDDYTINADYLASVKEVVDWTLDTGMYAIVNIHWDGGWWTDFPTDKENCMYKYTRIWTQLCDAFGNYGDKLMFESLNEEGGWDSLWNRYSGSTDGKQESFDLLTEINQKFVDIVRSSGGNNAERHLLIAGYNTDFDLTCDSYYHMPVDPMNRCAVSVHYYTPADFAILEEDASWGTMRSTWGTDADFQQLNHYMDLVKTTFTDKGIPVIIGEYGCPNKNKDADSVRLFLSSVAEEAMKRNLCPVLWDVTDAHYSRTTCTLKDTQLQANFTEILAKYGTVTETGGDMGDVNTDGSVNITDATLALTEYAYGAANLPTSLTDTQRTAADTDGDGAITIADATAILTYYAQLAAGLNPAW